MESAGIHGVAGGTDQRCQRCDRIDDVVDVDGGVVERFILRHDLRDRVQPALQLRWKTDSGLEPGN